MKIDERKMVDWGKKRGTEETVGEEATELENKNLDVDNLPTAVVIEEDKEKDMADKYSITYEITNGIPAIPLGGSTQNPAAPKHPLGLEMFDPAEMEAPIFAVKNATIDWVDNRVKPAESCFGGQEVLTLRKQEIDEWWEREKRVEGEDVAYYTRTWMDQCIGDLDWEVAYQRELEQLAKEGTKRGRAIAEQYLSQMKRTGRCIPFHGETRRSWRSSKPNSF